MIWMCFLKMLSDLCIFLSVTAFFALGKGSSPLPLLGGAFGMALLFALAALPEKKRWLRFLPLAGLAGLLLLPDMGLGGYILLGICAAYFIFCVARGAFQSDWQAQTLIFSRYWKILLWLFILACVLEWDKAMTLTLPFGTLALLSCILLNRSLRHEPAVAHSLRFQLVNGAALGGLVLGALILGSPRALSMLWGAAGWLYSHLIQPVLLAFVTVVVFLLELLGKLFSWIRFSTPDPERPSAAMEGGEASTEWIEVAPGHIIDPQVINALLILLGALLLCFLLWQMAKVLKKRRSRPVIAVSTTRYILKPEEKETLPRGPIRRIRELYRKYLKLYREADIPLSAADTSLEVLKKGTEYFDKKAMEGLREIYIRARYGDAGGKEDVEKARECYKNCAKNVSTPFSRQSPT